MVYHSIPHYTMNKKLYWFIGGIVFGGTSLLIGNFLAGFVVLISGFHDEWFYIFLFALFGYTFYFKTHKKFLEIWENKSWKNFLKKDLYNNNKIPLSFAEHAI